MVKNNLKYMIIFLIITLLMCIDVINVSAGTTCTVSANSGSGNKSKIGSTTKKCAGAICARTVVFKSGKFTESNGTSAIYGIRVSIQEKGSSGYTTKKKINVWATKEMKNWVVNKLNERSEIKNALGTHVFVSGTKLSSYGSSTKDPGIKRLDDSSATYNGYVKYLSNHPKILNKILKNFGGDYASVQDIIDSDEKIRIKIEPVYVLFVLGKSVDYPGFIIGTAQGITNIADHATNGSETNAVVVAQSKSNNGSISQNYYGGKVREIYSSMGSSYNVITNFLKSVFVNPKSIPKTYGGWHEKAGNGNAGVGYIYMKESCKTTGKITISNYQTRNNSNPKTGSTTFKGCATFELQKKKKDSDSYVNKGTFNIGTACNGSNDHKKQKTFKGLDKGTYRVILKKITKNPPEGKVTNTYYYYKTVKYNSNITGSLVIKQGQTSHTIAFYNYIPKVTTTTTSTKKYHILVSKNQLNGNFGTIAANAAVPASGNNFKYVYNDAAYSQEHPKNRNGCKTSSSDTTAGRIQCYALYINGTDYSNNLASVPTLQKYDGSVTFALEKKYGSSWREVRKKKFDADQMNDKIDPIIEWTVSSTGWYRVVEKGCSNCGTSKTYSKTQAFKDKSGNSVYTSFRQGKTSKGFYIADNTGKSASSSSGNPGTGNYFRVWFLNYSPRCVNCCPEMLAETKTENDTNKIKYKLISLYNYQLSENNRDFNKLLNFTPEDTASTIQSKIENETIWCETTNLAEKVTTNACNEADFGLSDNTSDKKLPMYKTTTENYLINNTTKYTNSNSISLSSYVSNTSNAKLVSNALFGFSSSDNVYCYVNYAFDYKTNGIIKPNTSVYSESLIWKTQPTNKVGDMFAFVHCEGIPEDSDSLNDNRGNLSDTILEIFKDGKLKIVDSSSTLLQTLSFKSMGEESFIYKPVETSDVECSALGEHFSLNSDGVCVYSDSTETEGDDATDVDTCGLNEVRINGICVDNSYENDLEDDDSDIGQENDDESGDSSDNSIIFYDESYASSYLSYDTILKYSIVYDEDLYSNVSTGTVNNNSE